MPTIYNYTIQIIEEFIKNRKRAKDEGIPLKDFTCQPARLEILSTDAEKNQSQIVHIDQPFSFGVLNRIVNFSLFLKFASLLATTLHVMSSCAADDML